MADSRNLECCKEEMIDRARNEFEEIFPCSDNDRLDDCFTTDHNRLMFWFNTRDSSTHMLSTAI